MNTSRKAAPMTKYESMILVKLVAANKNINNKATNATNNRLKEQAWQNLTNEFNSSVTSLKRTPSQLRLKWENLKKSARKRSAILKRNRNKTGDGYVFIPNDEILDKVMAVLSSTWQSLEFGGDVPNVTSSVPTQMKSEDNTNTDHSSDEEITMDEELSMEEESTINYELCKARIFKENALAEYFIAKTKKINLDNEEREVHITKLNLELNNARLENLKLKSQLNKLDINIT